MIHDHLVNSHNESGSLCVEKLVAYYFGGLKDYTKINNNRSCTTTFQGFISSNQNLYYLQNTRNIVRSTVKFFPLWFCMERYTKRKIQIYISQSKEKKQD